MVMILKYGVSKRQWCLFTYHFVSVVVVVLVLWHTLQLKKLQRRCIVIDTVRRICVNGQRRRSEWANACNWSRNGAETFTFAQVMAFIYQEWSVQPFSVITSHQMRWMHLTCMAVAAVARSSITLITQLQQRTATITFETKHIQTSHT